VQADWTGHPWVGGGYNSWPRPWTGEDPLCRMSREYEGLHFAGAEIAPKYRGYVEGAIRSGIAVAESILHAAAD
jgi:monoamine oxidase